MCLSWRCAVDSKCGQRLDDEPIYIFLSAVGYGRRVESYNCRNRPMLYGTMA